jgi:hypothetical protein
VVSAGISTMIDDTGTALVRFSAATSDRRDTDTSGSAISVSWGISSANAAP